MLQDSPLLDRTQRWGKDRNPTRDLAIWALHLRLGSDRTGSAALKERVVATLGSGAIAYVPSEQAKARHEPT